MSTSAERVAQRAAERVDALRPSLRTVAEWAEHGLPISTVSDDAAQLLDLSVRAYFSMSSAPYDGVGDATMIAEAALQHDPDALLGLIIKLAVPLFGAPQIRVSDKQLLVRARTLVADAVGSPWELAHLEVIEALLAGQSERVDAMLFRIIEQHPRDLMAVRLSFVFSGPDKNTRLLRNARVAAASFDETIDPVMHGFVQSELAYALEECGEYEDAEAIALGSYSKNEGDSWAAHQIAHVHEMTGRGAAGAAFMKQTFDSWRSGGLAGHNMWHWALMLVDAGERQEAIELFEGPILEFHGSSLAMGLQDIASLLYRLKLDDDPRTDAADIAEHWQTMADAIEGMLGKPTMSASTDIHIAMVLASAGRYTALEKQVAIMGDYDPDTVTARFLQAHQTSITICRAIYSYAQGDFSAAAQLLRSLDVERSTLQDRNQEGKGRAKDVHPLGLIPDAWRCVGLSNAQRDVLTQLLVSACYHSDNSADWSVAEHKLTQRREANLDTVRVSA